MRKGINSLIGVVHQQMGRDVRNGDVFIFIGSSRKLMKLLHAEDGGMVMYVKRLEAGRFRLPECDSESRTYSMEWRDLVLMVEGIKEDPRQRLRRLRTERNEYIVWAKILVSCTLLSDELLANIRIFSYLCRVIRDTVNGRERYTCQHYSGTECYECFPFKDQ